MADENLTLNQVEEEQLNKQGKPISKAEQKLNEQFASKSKRQKKRLFRRSRFRIIKNFVIWILGVLLLPLILAVATCLIPLSTYMDLAGVDTSEVGAVVKKPLVQSIFSLDEVKVKDVPVLEKALNGVVADAGLDGLVEFDLEALKDVALLGGDLSKITDCINVTATLKVIEEKFNDSKPLVFELENLGLFNEWEEAETPSPSATEEDLKAYYFKSGSTYKKAYNGTNREAESIGKTLYFPALSEISVLELKDVIFKSLDRIDIAEVLKSFNILEDDTIKLLKSVVNLEEGKKLNLKAVNDALATPDDLNVGALLEFLEIEPDLQNTIWGVLGKDKKTDTLTLGDVSNLKDIDLVPVLEYVNADGKTINFLKEIAGVEEGDKLTPEKITDAFDGIENLDLGKVLSFVDTSDEIIGLLRDIAGVKENEILTVNALTSAFSSENIKNLNLNVILDFAGLDEDTVDLLKAIAGVEEGETLTLNALTSAFSSDNIGNLNLNVILDFAGLDEDTVELLKGIAGVEEGETLTLNALTSAFSSDNIGILDLGVILDLAGLDDNTVKLLRDIAGLNEGDKLTVEAIKNVNVKEYLNTVKLKEYITDNDILEMIYNVIDFGENEKPESYLDLTIGDLTENTFDVNNYLNTIKLSDYINEESVLEMIYNVIDFGENEKPESYLDLTIGDLTKNTFNLNNYVNTVKLIDYLDESMVNVILNGIVLESGESRPSANELTIGFLTSHELDLQGTIDEIYLKDYIGIDMANVVCSALKLEQGETRPTGETLTIGDISGKEFSFDLIKLNDVMKYDESTNGKLYSILSDVLGVDKGEITIGALSSSFDTDKIKISSVVNNDSLLNVLSGVLGVDKDEITIGALSSGFDTDKIKISSVVNNEALINILLGAANKNKEGEKYTKDTLTVGALSVININYIYLVDVLPPEDYPDLYEVFVDIYTKDKDITEVTLEDLVDFDVTSVRISSVLNEYAEDSMLPDGEGGERPVTESELKANKKLWGIIKSAVAVGSGKNGEILLKDLETQFVTENIKLSSIVDIKGTFGKVLIDGYGEDVTVGDLMDFDVDNVKLTSILTEYTDGDVGEGEDKITEAELKANQKLWNIINSAVLGTGENGAILLKDLETQFTTNNIILSSIINLDGTLGNILTDIYGNVSELTVGQLSEFNTANVKLSSILNGVDNDTLKGILAEASGKNFSDIKVSDLASFDITSVKLSSVLNGVTNDTLKGILAEAVGNDFDKIKVSDLSSFDMTNVKLSSVITENTGNKILDDLINKDVKISEMGNAINGMELSVVIGETNCFTTELTGKAKYVKNEDGSFTLNPSGTYEISSDAGALLLLFYTSSGTFDDNGNVEEYTLKNCQIGNLANVLPTIAFSSCTISQLADCGLIANADYGTLSSKTISEILQMIADKKGAIELLFKN